MTEPDPRAAFHALTAVLDYPMFVVTCEAEGERGGCLVGFATQCSIDPPRYLVCISDSNHTAGVARRSSHLAVHVLTAGAERIAKLFGSETGDEVDKFARCDWRPGPGGAPLLADCPNWFVGRAIGRHETGDHTAYVLDLVDAAVDVERPHAVRLLTYQDVRDVTPGHEADE